MASVNGQKAHRVRILRGMGSCGGWFHPLFPLHRSISGGNILTLTFDPDENNINDGITYAIRLTTSLTEIPANNDFLWSQFANKLNSKIIIINNYFGQNRYGITGDDFNY